ncbi:MAG: putative DNA binding domain-containing protein [Deltaproteobacteria bacterium]|nr:putative DNA binding domain-containing protein [Deltaproteobacteria bacterium]
MTTRSSSAGLIEDPLIERLLAVPESTWFDVKRVGPKNDRKLETIIALANAEGGYLILGVEDAAKAKGRDRLIGIGENPESVDDLRRLLASRCTPPLLPPHCEAPEFRSISCNLRDGSVGEIVVVRVRKSSAVHSLVDGGTFVRLGSSNRQLSAAEIADLSLRRGTISYVTQTTDVSPDLLETDHWRAYAASRKLTRPRMEAMEHIGLLKREGDKLKATRAAVLLFAEYPADLLDCKASIRLFHYRGDSIEHGPSTNLARRPVTIDGPLAVQIERAKQALLDALATGVRVGPLGFEIAQAYPVRVLSEAITNAVLHRDYRVAADIHIRVFDNRVEVESPGLLPGPVTWTNIGEIGSHPRNRALVNHLRDFPNPPNLDAGEGVRMMQETMARASLYPPRYLRGLAEESVVVRLLNLAKPSVWDQVVEYVRANGLIGNAEVRKLLQTDNPLRASKQLRAWMEAGLLEVDNPESGKRSRRYRLPEQQGSPVLNDLFPTAKKTTGDL